MQGRGAQRDVPVVNIPAGWFLGVWLDAFAIGRAPVTHREYEPFLEATATREPPWWSDSRFCDPEQPIVGVTWFEAVAYCEWLDSTSHQGRVRLPTEAEWEKAARGGIAAALYPWGDLRPAVQALAGPPRVTETPANAFGLVALSGVCHEWCSDWYAELDDGARPSRNPRGPESGTRRVSRGGSWRHRDPWSRVDQRSSLPPDLAYADYGFRVAIG